MPKRSKQANPPPLAKHSRDCSICRHAAREAIEAEYIDWTPIAQIARSHRLQRRSIYLHVRACGLSAARDANIRAALLAHIEKGLIVKPTPASFVAAVVAVTKLNEQGRTVDELRIGTNLSEAFAGFSVGELRDYAEHGKLPNWYLSATGERSTGAN